MAGVGRGWALVGWPGAQTQPFGFALGQTQRSWMAGSLVDGLDSAISRRETLNDTRWVGVCAGPTPAQVTVLVPGLNA